MTSHFRNWLSNKWRKRMDPALGQCYRVTFSTLEGREVLQHLLDEVYCQTCPVNDPIALATHNGRRSVIQEILENIDLSEQPNKYTVTEEVNHV